MKALETFFFELFSLKDFFTSMDTEDKKDFLLLIFIVLLLFSLFFVVGYGIGYKSGVSACEEHYDVNIPSNFRKVQSKIPLIQKKMVENIINNT